jgi:hypothetical protein
MKKKKTNHYGKYPSGSLTKCDLNGKPIVSSIDCDIRHNKILTTDVAKNQLFTNDMEFYGDFSNWNLQLGDYVFYSDKDLPINSIYQVKRICDSNGIECKFIK